jgi:hypothetical protein
MTGKQAAVAYNRVGLRSETVAALCLPLRRYPDAAAGTPSRLPARPAKRPGTGPACSSRDR